MKTVGFPRMHKEKNEKRDFLPDLFEKLINENCEFYLEHGYGSDMGYAKDDYLKKNNRIKFVSHKECYEKDVIIVLRAPEFYELEWMKKGSILISMLHYPTRKGRNKKLIDLGINGISLDSIRNDFMERMIVNYRDTAGNGMELAFSELSRSMHNFYSNQRDVITVSIIGAGMVGLSAAKSAVKFGGNEIYEASKKAGTKGVVVKMISRNITCDDREMIRLLMDTDILVDASSRDNPSKYIIKNEMIGLLKNHSIILDLSCDPYLTDVEPMQVKAIEGIPTGNLDKPVIYADDEIYNTIPPVVNTKNKRTVVSCNAWPGIKPKECMELYGKQLLPFLKCIFKNNFDSLNEDSDDYFKRALYRGTIECYEKNRKYI
jgi:alanine dehydrogenase